MPSTFATPPRQTTNTAVLSKVLPGGRNHSASLGEQGHHPRARALGGGDDFSLGIDQKVVVHSSDGGAVQCGAPVHQPRPRCIGGPRGLGHGPRPWVETPVVSTPTSAAAKGVVSRSEVGRNLHIQCRVGWAKAAATSGRFSPEEVLGTENRPTF